MKQCYLTFILCIILQSVYCQSKLQPSFPDFTQIDGHARHCPETAMQSIEALSAYLSEGAETDIEKTRAIYVWLAEYMWYDDKAINRDKVKDYTVEEMLKRRLGVCEDYSNMFLVLGEKMGLKIMKVTGYAKGFGYRPRQRFKEPNHAWNLVEINGEWKIFDATWGGSAGEKTKKGKLKSVKIFSEEWFAAPPYKAIYTHLPENPDYALIYPVISKRSFELMPVLDDSYFKLGFHPENSYKEFYEDHTLQFPKCHAAIASITEVVIPHQRFLFTNTQYQFKLTVPAATELVLLDAKMQEILLEKNGSTFTIMFTPALKGRLKLCYRTGIKDPHPQRHTKDLHAIAEYIVRW